MILLGSTNGAGEVRFSQWPRFTPDERQEYFTFSPPELTALEQFHSHPLAPLRYVTVGVL